MVGDDEAGAHIRAYLADFGVELIASPSAHGSSRAVSTRSASGEPVYEFNDAAKARAHHASATPSARRWRMPPIVAVSCFPFDDARADRASSPTRSRASRRCSRSTRIHAPGCCRTAPSSCAASRSSRPTPTCVKVGEDDATLLYGEPLDALRARLVDLGVGAVLATQGAVRRDDRGGRRRRHAPDLRPARPHRRHDGRRRRRVRGGGRGPARRTRRPTTTSGARLLARAMDVAAATCRFEGALLRLPESLPTSISTASAPDSGDAASRLTCALRRRGDGRGTSQVGFVDGCRIFAARAGRVRWVIAPPVDCTSRAGARLASYPSGQRDLTVNQPA